MSTSATEVIHENTSATTETAPVRTLAGFDWIRRGIGDFRRAPVLSLLYGTLFAGLCGSVYLLTRNIPWFTTGYVTGLLVIGPFLAAGLYAASRDIERGTAPSIASSLRLLAQRKTYLTRMALS